MTSQKDVQNVLLRSLTAVDFASFSAQLQTFAVDPGDVLETPHEAITHAYFPESGLVSVACSDSSGDCLDVNLLGMEGMSGLAIVTGGDRSPNETVVRIAAKGSRIEAQQLRAAMDITPSLRPLLLRFAQTASIQTSHTALANGRSGIQARLARWLLMCSDRVGKDIPLTHELLARMLGIRRAGVTTATHAFEKLGLIGPGRGTMRVLDHAGLISAAKGSYGIPETEYKRVIGASA